MAVVSRNTKTFIEYFAKKYEDTVLVKSKVESANAESELYASNKLAMDFDKIKNLLKTAKTDYKILNELYKKDKEDKVNLNNLNEGFKIFNTKGGINALVSLYSLSEEDLKNIKTLNNKCLEMDKNCIAITKQTLLSLTKILLENDRLTSQDVPSFLNNNKEFWINAVLKNGANFAITPKELTTNRSFCEEIICTNGKVLTYLNTKILDNKMQILAYSSGKYNYEDIDKNLHIFMQNINNDLSKKHKFVRDALENNATKLNDIDAKYFVNPIFRNEIYDYIKNSIRSEYLKLSDGVFEEEKEEYKNNFLNKLNELKEKITEKQKIAATLIANEYDNKIEVELKIANLKKQEEKLKRAEFIEAENRKIEEQRKYDLKLAEMELIKLEKENEEILKLLLEISERKKQAEENIKKAQEVKKSADNALNSAIKATAEASKLKIAEQNKLKEIKAKNAKDKLSGIKF